MGNVTRQTVLWAKEEIAIEIWSRRGSKRPVKNLWNLYHDSLVVVVVDHLFLLAPTFFTNGQNHKFGKFYINLRSYPFIIYQSWTRNSIFIFDGDRNRIIFGGKLKYCLFWGCYAYRYLSDKFLNKTVLDMLFEELFWSLLNFCVLWL